MNKQQKEINQVTWECIKQQAVERLLETKELSGKNGAITPIIKMVLEAALEAELTHHLAQSETGNRKNGKAKKKLKTAYGQIEIEPS
ncbi:MAG: transposase, partial [Bacteroidota bacterium]